jgi:hypothetical protein
LAVAAAAAAIGIAAFIATATTIVAAIGIAVRIASATTTKVARRELVRWAALQRAAHLLW